MTGKRKTEQKSGRRGRVSPSSIPPAQRRFMTNTTPSQSWTNNSQPSTFQSTASTAAGVAVGSIIGQAIGSTLTDNARHVSSTEPESITNPADTQELCISEIQEFFKCASRNEDLDACKAFHNNWLKCQNVFKQYHK
ncbi:uncharacterized protein LOC143424370 [Xylocopa sonorina]|uniref:uncharacterized protein LOC143424370 n=1 Tax=Xylocopa sonorina TaxID=1818115 RepID=UPI00403A7D18